MPLELHEALSSAHLAIWTTTAWTLPANAAVAVNGRLKYTIVEAEVCTVLAATSCISLLGYSVKLGFARPLDSVQQKWRSCARSAKAA